MEAPKLFFNYPTREFDKQTLTDLSIRFGYIRSNLIKNSLYYNYIIRDEERPDNLSDRIYGTTKYDWVILIVNDIFDIYSQWPKSNKELEEYIKDKYGTLENAITTVHHYEDEFGYEIDRDTYFSIDGKKSIVTNYQYEIDLNDSKREIKIVDSSYISQIEIELRNLLVSVYG